MGDIITEPQGEKQAVIYLPLLNKEQTFAS